MNNLENSLLGKYDTIIFDLDKTIWDCYTDNGDSIGAYATMYPYKMLSSDVLMDVNGNIIKLQEGVRKVIALLDLDDKNLGIVSTGELEDRPFRAQPSVMLLKKFNLYKYFNYDIILRRGIEKRKYVRPSGRTLFIDDREDIIKEVEKLDTVDVLGRNSFKSWESLLSIKTSGLLQTLNKLGELNKQSSIVEDFIDLYNLEPLYSEVKRKIQWGEEIGDSENVNFLKAKSVIPNLFSRVIDYLTESIQDTLEWERKVPRNDRGDLRQQEDAQLKLIIDLSNRMKELIASRKVINQEDKWPYIFIAIDNTLNTLHLDFPYFMHLVWKDVDEIEDDNLQMKIEDRWNELATILQRQGKSVGFIEDVFANRELAKGEDYSDYNMSLDLTPSEYTKYKRKSPKENFRPNDESIYENNLHEDFRENLTERPLTPYGKLSWQTGVSSDTVLSLLNNRSNNWLSGKYVKVFPLTEEELNQLKLYSNYLSGMWQFNYHFIAKRLDSDIGVMYDLIGANNENNVEILDDNMGTSILYHAGIKVSKLSWKSNAIIHYEDFEDDEIYMMDGDPESLEEYKYQAKVNNIKNVNCDICIELYLREQHEKEAKSKGARFFNMGWSTSDDYITSKTSKGRLHSEIDFTTKKVTHHWLDDIESSLKFSKAEEQPSDAQIEAGNYKKKHVKKDGLDISIENERGSIRSGTAPDGTEWSIKMRNDYGYIKGTVGKDKDHIDCFLSNNYKENSEVYIVNQTNDKGNFDEHKVMLGFDNIGDAEKAYLDNYESGWDNYEGIIPMSLNEFKEWAKDKNLTKRPAEIKKPEKKNSIFICLWTPNEVRDKLSDIKNLEDELHVTLIYRPSADLSEDNNKKLLDKIAEVAKEYKKIEVAFGGTASFSNPDNSSVALVNIVEGPMLFNNLVNSVEDIYGPWDRKFGFTSHMTLHAKSNGKVPDIEPFNWTAEHIGVRLGDGSSYLIEFGTGKIEESMERRAQKLSWAVEPTLDTIEGLKSFIETMEVNKRYHFSTYPYEYITLDEEMDDWKEKIQYSWTLTRNFNVLGSTGYVFPTHGNMVIFWSKRKSAEKSLFNALSWIYDDNGQIDERWKKYRRSIGPATSSKLSWNKNPGVVDYAIEFIDKSNNKRAEIMKDFRDVVKLLKEESTEVIHVRRWEEYDFVNIYDDIMSWHDLNEYEKNTLIEFGLKKATMLSWKRISSPESYMSNSGIDISKEEFEDRARTFHVDEALTIDNQVEFPYGDYDEGHFVSLNIPMEHANNKSKKVLT